MATNGTVTKIPDGTAAFGTIVTQPTLDVLRAIGHDNGSGTTEEFKIVPGFPGTYRAKNFGDPSDSNEAKISAANLAAHTAGIRRVCVDADMIPYTTASVTLYADVQMVREGGNWAEYEPEAYGAGSADDSDALDAALSAAQSASGTLRLANSYPTSEPVVLTGSNGTGAAVRGVHRNEGTAQSVVEQTYAYGPILVAAGSHTFPTGAAFVTGTTASYLPGSNTWLQLRETCRTLDLNGLTAFTAEGWYRPGATGDGTLVASHGFWMPSDDPGGNTGCFAVYVAAGRFKALLTTSVTGKEDKIGTSSQVAPTDYHWAITYDGATFTLWLNGAQEFAQAMTGTLVQSIAEEVWFAAGNGPTPFNGAHAAPGGDNTLFGPTRFSDNCRYTVPFTPPTSFTNDSHTLLILDFAIQKGPLTKGQTKDGVAWIPAHQSGAGVAGAEVDVADLTVLGSATTASATGLFFCGQSYRPRVENFRVQKFRNGILAPEGNIYTGEFNNIYINTAGTGARYGIASGANAGLNHFSTVSIYGSALPWYSGSGLQVDNMFIQCTSYTVLGAHFGSMQSVGGATVNSLTVNTEAGVSADWRGALALSAKSAANLRNVITFNAATLESANDVAPVLVDNVTAASFTVPTFAGYGSSATLCHVLSDPDNPVVFRTPVTIGASVGLTDVPGTVVQVS